MISKLIRYTALSFIASATVASAQMIVHVVSGEVKAVSPQSISVSLDGGPASKFSISDGQPTLPFPNDLRATSIPPSNFQKTGDFVLVYYYGYGDDRTAVAIKDLGGGPYTKLQGAVTEYDKHTRKLTLTDNNGKQISLVLDNSMVVDTDEGVDSGRKFQPHRGDQVRVTFGAGSPPTVALLGEKL